MSDHLSESLIINGNTMSDNTNEMKMREIRPQRKVMLQNQIKGKTTSLTVFHLNVWNTDKYLTERMAKILYAIKLNNYDIVNLIDLPIEVYDQFKSNLDDYTAIQVFKTANEPCGTVIFIKSCHCIVEPYFYDYEGNASSNECARLIGCEIEVYKDKNFVLHILTTKLESKNEVIRNEQLTRIHEVISELPHYILTGDFQCNDHELIVKRFNDINFIDCWQELGCPYKIKYTLNRRINVDLPSSQRPDRIFYKSSKLSLIGMNLECLEPIITNTGPIQPTQHYGLSCEFGERPL